MEWVFLAGAGLLTASLVYFSCQAIRQIHMRQKIVDRLYNEVYKAASRK